MRTIVVHDVEVVVEFLWYEGHPATMYEPASEYEAIVEVVFVEGINIFHLCGDDTLQRIEDEIYKLYEQKEEL